MIKSSPEPSGEGPVTHLASDREPACDEMLGSRIQGDSPALPKATVAIPAHNEAKNLGRKIENCLSLEYAGDLQIIVISDGSTDDTVDTVRRYGKDERLTLLVVEERLY